MASKVPPLDKTEARLQTPEDHARALEQACRAAAQILASRGGGCPPQEPLPPSSVRLLKRLAKRGD